MTVRLLVAFTTSIELVDFLPSILVYLRIHVQWPLCILYTYMYTNRILRLWNDYRRAEIRILIHWRIVEVQTRKYGLRIQVASWHWLLRVVRRNFRSCCQGRSAAIQMTICTALCAQNKWDKKFAEWNPTRARILTDKFASKITAPQGVCCHQWLNELELDLLLIEKAGKEGKTGGVIT